MKKIIILLMLLPFVFGDIAYFNSIDNYDTYSYDDHLFTDKTDSNQWYFLNSNPDLNILEIDTKSDIMYSTVYKYYSTENNFYVINGSFIIKDSSFNFPSSTFGWLLFYNTATNDNIRLILQNQNFTVTQTDGILVCENDKRYSEKISENVLTNYEIYVKNDTNTIVLFSFWNATEEKPLFFQRNCTIQLTNDLQYGTFGIFGRNITVSLSSLNILGYDIINTEDTGNYSLDTNTFAVLVFIIILYILLFIISYLTKEKILLYITALYGIFMTIFLFMDGYINFLILVLGIGFNTILYFMDW